MRSAGRARRCQRKTRGRTLDEPLGGAAAPVVEISGRGELVLGPALGQRLLALAIDADPVYVREDALVGFELGVAYENGRLPVGDGEAIAMVQLRGQGAAVVTASERSAALEIGEGKSTALRASRVLGWVGRVVPRGLSPSEAPGALRGFVTFAGEGMVILNDAVGEAFPIAKRSGPATSVVSAHRAPHPPEDAVGGREEPPQHAHVPARAHDPGGHRAARSGLAEGSATGPHGCTGSPRSPISSTGGSRGGRGS